MLHSNDYIVTSSVLELDNGMSITIRQNDSDRFIYENQFDLHNYMLIEISY